MTTIKMFIQLTKVMLTIFKLKSKPVQRQSYFYELTSL